MSSNEQAAARKYQINQQDYQEQYARSLQSNDAFWLEKAKNLDWITPPALGFEGSYDAGNISIKWFADGVLNVSANCIDRHLANRADETAIIWESDTGDESSHISFQTLHDEVCKLANGLKQLGVEKGDRVIIYMPMIPQATYAMLACARIGAVHSVVFGGFSPKAIADRVNDCGAKVVITADALHWRRGRYRERPCHRYRA